MWNWPPDFSSPLCDILRNGWWTFPLALTTQCCFKVIVVTIVRSQGREWALGHRDFAEAKGSRRPEEFLGWMCRCRSGWGQATWCWRQPPPEAGVKRVSDLPGSGITNGYKMPKWMLGVAIMLLLKHHLGSKRLKLFPDLRVTSTPCGSLQT